MVLRIFGLKRDEVMEDWRKLHNEELHNFCPLPDIIRMIKSRRKEVGWTSEPVWTIWRRENS
jgi:hypothetical protein